ncbi:MAG: hypothetical protein WBA12_09805, partial [Catalinimonas sp.]
PEPAGAAAEAPVAYPTPGNDTSSSKLKAASAKQRADLLLLLSHASIRIEERDRMVKSLKKLDSVRAEQAIRNLRRVIRERGE